MKKNLTYLYPFIVAAAGLVFAAGESAAFFVSFYSGNDFGYWGFFFANCAAAVLFAALSLAGAAAFVVVRRKSKRGTALSFLIPAALAAAAAVCAAELRFFKLAPYGSPFSVNKVDMYFILFLRVAGFEGETAVSSTVNWFIDVNLIASIAAFTLVCAVDVKRAAVPAAEITGNGGPDERQPVAGAVDCVLKLWRGRLFLPCVTAASFALFSVCEAVVNVENRISGSFSFHTYLQGADFYTWIGLLLLAIGAVKFVSDKRAGRAPDTAVLLFPAAALAALCLMRAQYGLTDVYGKIDFYLGLAYHVSAEAGRGCVVVDFNMIAAAYMVYSAFVRIRSAKKAAA